MAEKFMTSIEGGGKKFKKATTESRGAEDGGKIPALGDDGRFNASMMPSGYGTTSKAFSAAESLAAGDLVNIFNDGGTFKARKADASDVSKSADGFVKDVTASGAMATVFFEGEVVQTITGGFSRLYLTSTPGKAGEFDEESSAIMQFVGTQTSATTFNFVAEEPVQTA